METPAFSRWFVTEDGESHELFLIKIESALTAQMMVETGYPSFETRADAYRAKDWMQAWLGGVIVRLASKSGK